MTAVQPSKVDMCRLLSDQPVGAIEYIDKEVNVKEFDWDYWQLHRCEKTTLHTVKLTVKILSIFVVFSENVNFNYLT